MLETSFWGNGLLCTLRMYHYGRLWDELTLLSEMYADVMDITCCNLATEFPVPKFCFFDFFGVHRGPGVEEAIRLQKTSASTVPQANVLQIGTALEAMRA